MSLLSRIFRRPGRKPQAVAEPLAIEPAPDAPSPAPEAATPPPADVEPEPPSPPPEPQPTVDGEELEEDDEDEPQAALGPDPYFGSGEALKISLPTPDAVASARIMAVEAVLASPQRITLTDPAGPGSLAEALAQLEAEGLVTSDVADDPDLGPCLIYRPRSSS